MSHLALFGSGGPDAGCPLLREDRKWLAEGRTDAIDPMPTFETAPLLLFAVSAQVDQVLAIADLRNQHSQLVVSALVSPTDG